MDLTGVSWRKSSYSGSNGGDCVEVAEVWRKSSYSGSNGGDCVEVARCAARRRRGTRFQGPRRPQADLHPGGLGRLHRGDPHQRLALAMPCPWQMAVGAPAAAIVTAPYLWSPPE